MAYLEFDGQTRVLGPGVLIIGSGRESGWRIEDRRLDRIHALVSLERDGRVVLNRGNDSAWVDLNGFPIDTASVEVKPGDEVRLGDAVFRLKAGIPHAPTEVRGAYLRDVRRERWYHLGPTNAIGRDLSCTVLILDPDISRIHAELVREGQGFTYKVHPRRGVTLVNGHRITEPRKLEEGDDIMVGQTTLRFTTVAPTQQKPTAPVPRVSSNVRQAAQMQTTFMSPLALREQVRKKKQRKVGTVIAGVSGVVAVIALIISAFRGPSAADARRLERERTTSSAAGRLADSAATAATPARAPQAQKPDARLPDSVPPLEAAPVVDEPITGGGVRRQRP
jgi:predicted component of type VI protein secretion system